MPDTLTLYTVKQAAALAGYHPRSLNRLLKAGQLDVTRVGWQYLFTESQIEALRARPKGKRLGR